MSRKQFLIGFAVAFQVLAVASMVFSREWILATGEPYLFQTAPVDPRDIFRGDYVRLEYLFSRVPVERIDEAILQQGLHKGQKVYLSVSRDINGVTQGGRLSLSPPAGKPYLAGRSTEHWPSRYYGRAAPDDHPATQFRPVSVKYGIEQYYVEQGAGREMEEIRGGRDGFQVPLLIHAGVSASGEAVIRSYEWANLATKTEIVRSPQRNVPDDEASAVVQFTIKNRSDRPITLPLKEGNCSFTLIPAQWAPVTDFAGERPECATAKVEKVVLAPGETHGVSFDLNRPHWYVLYNNKPTPPGKLPWNYRYRIKYQGETIPGVNAMMLSRAFHGRGNID